MSQKNDHTFSNFFPLFLQIMSVTDDLLKNIFFTQRFQNVITERLAFIQVGLLLPRCVVGSVQRQPPIWWCHQLVAHPSETVRLPWQVHERGTVYRQLSTQPPHRLPPLKKNLNHFCLDCHSVCDNVYRSLTMFSALAAVCTV